MIEKAILSQEIYPFIIYYSFGGFNKMRSWQEIQKSINWIEHNLQENISIEMLADIANLSPVYFQRLFTNLVGIPAMEYVKRRRLARVSDRMIFNSDNILESCLYYGFKNHETFSREFKKHMV